MVGREVSLTSIAANRHPAGAALTVERARSSATTAATRSSTASTSRSGRARSSASPGVAGNGQDELIEAIVGLRKPSGGTVTLEGTDITGLKSRDVYEHGVGLRPGRPPSVRAGPVVQHRRQPRPDQLPPPALLARAAAQRRRDPRSRRGADQGVRHPDHRRREAKASTLSGGNQQKVVIAREFSRDLRCSCSTSRPAASTSAASSSSTSRRSPSAMPGRRSCSCRPSSTRSSSCRTGSRSSIAASSSACATGGPPTRTTSAC